ncbi:MAG: glutamate-5-semialdehyde dehydrogenase [Clostridia bacterium]|nr:glutamate-5-semialdehyde dehydrogenase [Clostridia bacterium]
MTVLEQMGEKAKKAAQFLSIATKEQKNKALESMASSLLDNMPSILKANAQDIQNAKEAGIKESLIDRLLLSESRIQDMSKGILDVSNLEDPIGEVLNDYTRPNGLHIQKIRVPMGVIGIIYEARPNVTSDAAALCLKSGNATILRGGKEAIASNKAIEAALRAGLKDADFPEDCVQLVQDTSRESANEMMHLNGYLSVLIPRGGAGLIQSVVKNATVPVIETGIGNCHVYVDKAADPAMATAIIVNAKVSRPSVCNAAETLLVHKDIAPTVLPVMAKALKENHVEIRGDKPILDILGEGNPATEEDWATEYGDYILAVKIVSSLDEAIDHITRYGTGHSECIVTADDSAAKEFTARIDAAAVYVNASTRFTDGGEFGMGAEIGISTQKLHARGPMGLPELTSYKYIVTGNGQIR